MRRQLSVGITMLALVLMACGGESDPETLTIISHDSFAGGVSKETFAAFTAETGIAVKIVPAGDAGIPGQPGDSHQGQSLGRRAVRRG